MAVAADTERTQVGELTRVLQEQQVGDPERLEMIRGEILAPPMVDRDLLRLNRVRLEHLR